MEHKQDVMTGLRTKNAMWDKLRSVCDNDNGSAATLVSIDMDNLKQILTKHGRQEANSVISHIGKELATHEKQNIHVYRVTETAGKFMMIIENQDKNGSFIIADSIRLQIEKNGRNFYDTTVSMGLVIKELHESAEEWHNRAHKAAIWAKKCGNNCVWDYDYGEPSQQHNCKKKNHFKNKNKTTRPPKNTSENSQTHSLGSLENDIFSDEQKHSSCYLSSLIKFSDSNEPIVLNIGGVKYETTLITLLKYKDCIFNNMKIDPNRDGSYFIDRNGKYFEYILDYLRNGQLNIPNSRNKDSYLINHLLSEAKYYKIAPLLSELAFLKIGTKLLSPNNLQQIESWIIEQFKIKTELIFQWKLLYEWNCDDITLKNPYNVMHAKCEGISSILIVLLCGNRIFGAYTSVKWKAKDVNDNESFVYWFGNNQNMENKKFKFHYESYREFKSYDTNSENHRCMKFCGGYNDVVVCRYRATRHQYGHFSIYTNETGYTVTASGPLSLDNSMHLQRMEIFHI